MAALANMGLNLGDVTHLAGTVDDDKQFIRTFFEKHQVVNDAAFFIEQQAVTLFAHRQVNHIDWNQ